MTKAEFETWVAHLLKPQQEEATGFFTVIREKKEADVTTLVAIPYSEEYKDDLTRAANLLKEAANLTDNATLKNFLNLRADAFLSNDYYASDMAWMDLDAPTLTLAEGCGGLDKLSPVKVAKKRRIRLGERGFHASLLVQLPRRTSKRIMSPWERRVPPARSVC